MFSFWAGYNGLIYFYGINSIMRVSLLLLIQLCNPFKYVWTFFIIYVYILISYTSSTLHRTAAPLDAGLSLVASPCRGCMFPDLGCAPAKWSKFCVLSSNRQEWLENLSLNVAISRSIFIMHPFSAQSKGWYIYAGVYIYDHDEQAPNSSCIDIAMTPAPVYTNGSSNHATNARYSATAKASLITKPQKQDPYQYQVGFGNHFASEAM